jgi:hypothetical protein
MRKRVEILSLCRLHKFKCIYLLKVQRGKNLLNIENLFQPGMSKNIYKIKLAELKFLALDLPIIWI